MLRHAKGLTNGLAALCLAAAMVAAPGADACTRVLYETGTGTYIVGRSMDWNDLHMQTDLWVFPRGMARDGGVGPGSIAWTSKYGSVILSVYDLATSDGINEKGMAGNLLYLAESDFGDAAARGKPTLSVGAWLQYLLDNYGTVAETVAAMQSDPFTVVTANAPNGRPASVHIALSDPTGDSAILEYVGGKLQIHHGRLSVGAWLQYLLDNYGTVAATVAAMQSDPFTVVTANAPNGRAGIGPHRALRPHRRFRDPRICRRQAADPPRPRVQGDDQLAALPAADRHRQLLGSRRRRTSCLAPSAPPIASCARATLSRCRRSTRIGATRSRRCSPRCGPSACRSA